eukprot:TRINITY_DN1046_c0_g1_i1.p1 TRINITY_DN1046_c0_g1~~TRINITY_DN1046_c0_g1_i1.p1  ORF type:complete len:226 (+),score=35.75 TRINITY_DN1046_c0_g1_i1:57-734(+)
MKLSQFLTAPLLVLALQCGFCGCLRLADRSGGVRLKNATASIPAASTRDRCQAFRTALVALGSSDVFVCPVDMSDKTTNALPYFADLHKLLVHGNGYLQGCLNESAQEHYVTAFEKELECLFATIVEDKCGSLPSQFDSRQVKWEHTCLDPKQNALAAYNLMSKDEQTYFYRFKEAAVQRQVYATYLELASYKELVCMFMKAVDDECAAMSKPRTLPPSHWKPLS